MQFQPPELVVRRIETQFQEAGIKNDNYIRVQSASRALSRQQTVFFLEPGVCTPSTSDLIDQPCSRH